MKYKIYSKNPLGEKILSKFNEFEESNAPDFAFSFGGDGTFLKSHRLLHNSHKNVIYVPFNLGHIGFYTEYKIEDLDNVLSEIKAKTYSIRTYPKLLIEVEGKEEQKSTEAINEIAITNPIGTAVIDIYINEELFETYRGTGLLVSTPSGSTAYNKSVGGSIIDLNIDAMQITEIAPINNRVYKSLNSSLIVSKDTVIELVIHNKDNTFLCVDGKSFSEGEIEKVRVTYSPNKIKVMCKNSNQFTKIKNTFLK